ncbi:DNA repair protein RecN [Sulfurirhabdus autotrophica]|uniref:DNA repair protein RecN n=1 Tax=Sulfurirhabdus autotrophica TaxID=1706046 RepID=A0A4R3YFX6_9PROT|nr:DNA repair protein RecN [Sulfurirhabdus autotrophica]TCV90842.1 DNA repair protein RecN (Recombination protein N) [Sulfurirhabdus autotrophica]
MLLNLSVRDFVIVDKLDLEFTAGFTVLTGETGAGKSILIDALALVLGERGDSGVVRAGCERAELIAEFDIQALPELKRWLEENDLAGDPDVCLMRRIIDANGRSRGFINGRQATQQQLRDAGEWLVDIHGQHAHQSLLRQNAQRELLDGYAGLRGLCGEVTEAYRRWQELRKSRLEWEKDTEAHAQEREQLEWQVREVKGLSFSLVEWEELLAEHARLSNSASLMEGAQFGLELLSEGESACLPQISALASRLKHLQEFDASLKETLDVLEPAEIQLQEAVYSLRHYLQRLDLDPERLRTAEQRLDEVHSIARKYRTTPDQLPELLNQWQSRLDALGGAGESGNLQQKETEAQTEYLAKAKKLSAGRQTAAKTLSQKVSASMQSLAMAGGQFEVGLPELPEGSAYGLEQIEFLVSSHGGVTPKPLAKVASGGELSRISLAIQVITSKISKVPTLIFDEVDVGIGGGVAEIVGQMLRKLGDERQVLCITHLPQVAALGQNHWQVAKTVRSDTVVSQISVLEKSSRIDEIARMLGGVDITQTTRKHAEEMLGFEA